MFSHATVGTSDLAAAINFYRGLLDICDWELKFIEEDDGWAGWKPKTANRPLFVVCRPLDGNTAAPGNGQMLAFQVARREMVDLAHDHALRFGGRDEGPPGLRPHYHADYYGAYFRDLDGNKICVCCHEPEA